MHTIIRKELSKQKDILEKAIQGDYSHVCYLEGKHKRYGQYDKNYTNRLRLAYYILFENVGTEAIIKRLFEEELKDRETNSFQEIGTNLEILTCLLMQYNENNKYEDLFKRAKMANFDCACGYDKNNKMESDLSKYDIYDCIHIAAEMEYMDCASVLVNQWKETVTEWNEQSYSRLISFNKNIKNEVENEEPLKALLKIQMKKGDNRDIILAWKDLIHFYIQFDKCEQAYKNFIEMKNKVDRSAFYEIGHLKFMLEDCMDLICKYEETAANQNQEQIQKDINDLWDWAKPFIKELSDNMHGNLYKKSIEAAETVNDQFAEELLEKYVLWEMRMKL